MEPILPVTRSDRPLLPVEPPRPYSREEREAARRDREKQRERRRKAAQRPPEGPGTLDIRV